MENNIKSIKEYKNIKEILYESVKKYGSNAAFTIKHKKDKETTYENISYEQLLDDVNSLGTAFYNLGFQGKRIAIIGKNRYEWVITHLANLLGSIISIPLDKDLQYGELENSLIRSKADVIIYDSKLSETISQIKKNGNTQLTEYFCMDDEGKLNIPKLIKQGRKLIKQGEAEYLAHHIDENEMAILLFTSGTTSQSKAVMLSQKNIASNVYAIQSMEDMYETDVNIAFLPYHHVFGGTLMIMVLAFGAKTVFPDGIRYIKQNLNEYKVTVFVGVPVLVEAIYKTIMKEIEHQKKTKIIAIAKTISNFLLQFGIDIRRKIFKQILSALGGELRLIISGGAPADPKILKGFNEFGIEVLQGYGLSETSPIIAVETSTNKRNGSVGKPVINDTIEISNPDNNGIGEIRVKGPNVMLGYYEMPDITKQVLKNGWFYTGDLGYFDQDGYLFITGRSKNMIVLKNGKKIFPEELETLVNRLELVLESMVFGLANPNDKNDVKLSIKVVYDQETIKEKFSNETEEEIRQILWNQIKEINKTFPKYKRITNMITTHDELIKTTTKKIKRQEELKQILNQVN